MNKPIKIAIDGPVASGKGTIARLLAEKLNGIYLDTGAMYRCVALYCLNNGIDLNNPQDVISSLKNIHIDFIKESVLLNGNDVTKEIRTLTVDNVAPKVAHLEKVREDMILRQQNIAASTIKKGITFIAEGRDIATHVLPNADLKIFLTADPKTRASRRVNQLENRGEKEDFDKVLGEIKQRDFEDIEENHALVKTPEKFGYFILDDSNISKEETCNIIINLANKL